MLVRAVLLIAVLLLAAEVGADAAEAAKEARTALPAAAVQVAPGGGEMIILDRASRYITRGGVDQSGRLTVDCEREGNGAQIQRSPEKHP